MYKVKTTVEISAAHQLELDYESPCRNLHGHNWKIDVYCRSKHVDRNGMVVDFTRIKSLVKTELDHKKLNDVLTANPTAENIAAFIAIRLNKMLGNAGSGARCYRVDVEETPSNVATFECEE